MLNVQLSLSESCIAMSAQVLQCKSHCRAEAVVSPEQHPSALRRSACALTGAQETIQSPLWPWRRLEKLTFTGDKLGGLNFG